MNVDITRLLSEWPYDPDSNVRIIDSDSGRKLMQVRQPLGIEQYELDGRPDGLRPDGKETVVAAIKARLAAYQTAHGSDAGFVLAHDECVAMQSEGVLFYYRYLMLFQMNDFERVTRDTDHNLTICDLLQRYCHDEDDRIAVLQFKPYIYRMNAVSKAMQSVQQHDRTTAGRIIRQAVNVIEAMNDIATPAYQFERVRSVNYLQSTLEKIDESLDDPLNRLESELVEAVENEDYERAARLRDSIRDLS